MPKSDIHRKITEGIQPAKRVLLMTHQKPDGDAAGSILAMREYLARLNKEVVISFCVDQLSPLLYFLPGSEQISTEQELLKKHQYDLLIVLDSGDLEYTGVKEGIKKLNYQPTIINIDHHISNTNFGHFNMVNHNSSSTSEMIYDFFGKLGVKIDQKIATCLLTGILTDTDNFSNLATTSSSMKAASELLLRGAKLRQITNNVLKNKSLCSLRLWGKVLSRLKKDQNTGLVSTVITKDDIIECGGEEEASNGIANFLNKLKDAKVVMVLRENGENIVKASLRTTNNSTDVSQIAKLYGGGGHRKAAGFSMKGKVVEEKNSWKIEK